MGERRSGAPRLASCKKRKRGGASCNNWARQDENEIDEEGFIKQMEHHKKGHIRKRRRKGD